jgi:hypothetical protein
MTQITEREYDLRMILDEALQVCQAIIDQETDGFDRSDWIVEKAKQIITDSSYSEIDKA